MGDNPTVYPHPNSPHGAGGPGSFRIAGPVGVREHFWAELNGDPLPPDLLNLRIPAELKRNQGWFDHHSLSPLTVDDARRQVLAQSTDIEKIRMAVERALPKLPGE